MPAVSLRDAAGVRAAARAAQDADQVRRLLAIAAVYEGKPRSAAAQAGVMDRQTLRDWVHRFNAQGFLSLRVAAPSGSQSSERGRPVRDNSDRRD